MPRQKSDCRELLTDVPSTVGGYVKAVGGTVVDCLNFTGINCLEMIRLFAINMAQFIAVAAKTAGEICAFIGGLGLFIQKPFLDFWEKIQDRRIDYDIRVSGRVRSDVSISAPQYRVNRNFSLYERIDDQRAMNNSVIFRMSAPDLVSPSLILSGSGIVLWSFAALLLKHLESKNVERKGGDIASPEDLLSVQRKASAAKGLEDIFNKGSSLMAVSSIAMFSFIQLIGGLPGVLKNFNIDSPPGNFLLNGTYSQNGISVVREESMALEFRTGIDVDDLRAGVQGGVSYISDGYTPVAIFLACGALGAAFLALKFSQQCTYYQRSAQIAEEDFKRQAESLSVLVTTGTERSPTSSTEIDSESLASARSEGLASARSARYGVEMRTVRKEGSHDDLSGIDDTPGRLYTPTSRGEDFSSAVLSRHSADYTPPRRGGSSPSVVEGGVESRGI